MKIYTLLQSSKGLSKIITYPEHPDSDIELFFDHPEGKSDCSKSENIGGMCKRV